MATACVVSGIGDGREREQYSEKIWREWTIGWDGVPGPFMESCAGICINPSRRCNSFHPQCHYSAPALQPNNLSSTTCREAHALVAEVLLSIPRLQEPGTEDPSHGASNVNAHDLDPDAQSFARSRIELLLTAPAIQEVRDPQSVPCSMVRDSVDFGEAAGVQTRPGKAAKKAAKKAQQAKWMDSDNEEDAKNADGGGDGGGGGGGGGDGGAGGGAGGFGGGDGGGDDNEDWDQGGKKNKKNKKKARQEEEERKAKEEEERKKAEEEEKKNTEGNAADANLGWADDANDVNVDDEWAFPTKKEKKKKKTKGAENLPVAPDPSSAAFQEINLEENVPQLDLSFDAPEPKETSSSAFGGWGKPWGLGAIGTAASSNKKDDKPLVGKDKEVQDNGPEFANNNPWSFGGKSKSKKKTPVSNDFDFGDFGAGHDIPPADQDPNEGLDAESGGQDNRAFSSANAKDKAKDKKKPGKGNADEQEKMSAALPGADKEAEVDSSWATWATGKKKGKKIASEAESSNMPWDTTASAFADGGDDWANFGTGKKEKRKDPKISAEEAPPEKKVEESTAGSLSAFDWNAPLSKKEKKNKSKGQPKETEEDPIVAIENAGKGGITAAGDYDWLNSGWATEGKRRDQQGTIGPREGLLDAYGSMNPADFNSAAPNTLFGNDDKPLGGSKSRKDKNGKKSGAKASDIQFVPPPSQLASEPIEEDYHWGTFDKNDKKSGEKGTDTFSDPVISGFGDTEKHAEEAKEDSTWGFGLTSKEKKKREKEAKKKGFIEPPAHTEAFKMEEEQNAVNDDAWDDWGKAGKRKNNKKGKDEPPPPVPTPPAQGLTPEPSPAAGPIVENDDWGDLTTTKAKGSSKKGILSRSATMTDKSSKAEPAKEETGPKATKSIWGSFGGTSSSAKSKLAKEKAQKEEEKARLEEEATKEAEDAAHGDLFPETTEKPIKSSKSKAGKTSKTEKESDKKKVDEEDLIDVWDQPSATEDKFSTKTKTSDAKTTGGKKDKDSQKNKEKKSDDYFGFWGTSKKTTGKKDSETKQEINKSGVANGNDALGTSTNGLEGGDEADEPTATLKPSKTMSTAASKNKSSASSSVAAKIKAFEANKKDDKVEALKSESQRAKDLSASSALVEDELPKEEKKQGLSKSKVTSASTSKSNKKKQSSSPSEDKKSREIVPGSFPGGFGDDDEEVLALNEPALAPEKMSGKKAKGDRKPNGKSKTVKIDEDVLMEAPEAPKLPTPPPEEKKPAKKERARVERTGAASSWGLWATSPASKKDSAKKESPKPTNEDEATSKRRSTPGGLSRSKSTRSPREREREDRKEAEKASKSSESDNKETLAATRPNKPSRGMSFSAFMMGGPPPSASRNKPTRRSSVAGGSRSNSRRNSVDVMDGGGLVSPPPDDVPPVSDKVAKMLGVKGPQVERTKSKKDKHRASVAPDPHPTDDDDMVIVNDGGVLPNEDFAKSPPKAKMPARSKSKREVSYKQSKSTKPRARTLSNEDDVVMVEAGPAGGETFGAEGLGDPATRERSGHELKRSNTTSKKAGGFFGGLFGGGNKADKATEAGRTRPPSSYRDEKMVDAETLASKGRDKPRRHSMKAHANDVEPAEQEGPDLEAEARRAQRRAARDSEEAERAERRKSRREKEKAELEDRRSKARDRARKQQEAEEQRREEKRAKRAAREDARHHEETNAEAAVVERKGDRRRQKGKFETPEKEKGRDAIAADRDALMEKLRRSKEDRKKQFEHEEQERLRRREEKLGKSRTKDKAGKHKSTNSPLMDEYFDSRNGTASPKQPGGPTDKISSWVKSQASDPPDMPPVEGTILDGEKPRSGVIFDDALGGTGGEGGRKRSSKHDSSRRHSKYGPDDADPEDRRAARRRESKRSGAARIVETDQHNPIKSGNGSAGDDYFDERPSTKHRPKRREVNEDYDAYADGGPASPMRSPEVRPQNPKRNSIFGRLGGLL